jgi:hypothetical protein
MYRSYGKARIISNKLPGGKELACLSLSDKEIGNPLLGSLVIYAQTSSVTRSTYNLSAFIGRRSCNTSKCIYQKTALKAMSMQEALLIAKEEVGDLMRNISECLEFTTREDVHDQLEGL